MTNYLYKETGLEFLIELNNNLKESTKTFYNENYDSNRVDYTPFMSFKLKNQFADIQKLIDLNYEKGGLITSKKSLNEIHSFFLNEGSSLTLGMPVIYEDWPVMTDIEKTRIDAISSFREGKALLKNSPFLFELYKNLIEFVIPLDRERPSGFDNQTLRGVILRTFPKGRSGLLAGFQLAHAMGHHVALMLESIDPIYKSDKFEIIEYSVRNDKRTVQHAFVSSVALSYMAILAKDIYGSGNEYFIADEHIRSYSNYIPDAVASAVESINKSKSKFTDFGLKLLLELEEIGQI